MSLLLVRFYLVRAALPLEAATQIKLITIMKFIVMFKTIQWFEIVFIYRNKPIIFLFSKDQVLHLIHCYLDQFQIFCKLPFGNYIFFIINFIFVLKRLWRKWYLILLSYLIYSYCYRFSSWSDQFFTFIFLGGAFIIRHISDCPNHESAVVEMWKGRQVNSHWLKVKFCKKNSSN